MTDSGIRTGTHLGLRTFDFIADRPVLDFVATVAERGTTHLDKLTDATELARWLGEAGLVDNGLEPTAGDLKRAKALREAMFRTLMAIIDHAAVGDADRRLINSAAARPRPVSSLSSDGEVRRTGDLDAALAVLATECIELFRGADRDLLSRCADPRCTRLFIDRSRGQRRRWCDMKGCGDRAKAGAYRQRRARTRVSDAT